MAKSKKDKLRVAFIGAGGIAGARLGEELDSKVLDNVECRQCGHAFRPHVE